MLASATHKHGALGWKRDEKGRKRERGKGEEEKKRKERERTEEEKGGKVERGSVVVVSVGVSVGAKGQWS